MNDREQLSALIADIYDAALDPDQRTVVLDKIASFTGGQSGGLLSKHSLSKSETLYCYVGADSESLQAYSESYPKLDPTADSPSYVSSTAARRFAFVGPARSSTPCATT